MEIEIEIEKRKKEYYKALMAGQKNRKKESEKIDQWILFFLETLELTIIKLESRYNNIKDKKSYLSKRQEKLLDYIKAKEPIKISDAQRDLVDYKLNTLRKDIFYLKTEGLIQQIGKGRATIYVVNEAKNKS